MDFDAEVNGWHKSLTRLQFAKIPTPARKALADLRELFPERALLLVQSLHASNQKEKKFPEWREDQIGRFGSLVSDTAADLVRAYLDQRIMPLAWATRNLLELSIWIVYCNLSDVHAKGFWDVAVRDVYGLSDAVRRSVELESREAGDLVKTALGELSTFAQTVGIKSLRDDFKRVSDAADELGEREEFLSTNKMLSKWAHPTAWVARASKPAADEGCMTMVLQDGVELAMNSIITIRQVIREHYPDIAKAKGD